MESEQPKKKRLTAQELLSEIDNENRMLVIDNGSDSIKIGFSGEDSPRIVLPAISAKQKEDKEDAYINKINRYIGYEAIKHAKDCEVYPLVTKGHINPSPKDDGSEDPIHNFWKEVIERKLQVEIQNANVLLITSPHHDNKYKEALIDRFLGDLKVNSLNIMNSASLSLFSTGATRGFIIEVGHGITTTVPVFEGYILKHAMHNEYIAGDSIIKYLEQELKKKGITIKDNALQSYYEAKKIKEQFAEVSLNYQQQIEGVEFADEDHRKYELPGPGAEVIDVGHKLRLGCGEILFDPTIVGSNAMPLQDMIRDSIMRTDLDFQTELFGHIVMCGGTSMMKGFQERIHQEILDILPDKVDEDELHLPFDSFRRYSAWIGGSMIGSLSTFQKFAIQQSDYNDESIDQKNAVIHKKML